MMPLPRPTTARPLCGLAFVLCLVLAGKGASSSPAGPGPSAPPAPSVKVTGAEQIKHGVEGAVDLTLPGTVGRAVIEFSYPGEVLDLSAFRDLAVQVQNGSDAELDVLVSGTSSRKDDYTKRVETRFLVRPGEHTALHVFMVRPALPKDHAFVRRLGDLYAFPWGHQSHWRHLDAAAIVRVTVEVTWHGARSGQTLRLKHPVGLAEYSVDPARLDTLAFPLVDELGQDCGKTWPGKAEDAAELRADAGQDQALVAATKGPRAGRSRFGGDLGSPPRAATGFFRVEKIDGRWWFVDPEGHLFWSLGINGAGTSSTTRVKGREHLFPKAVRDREELDHYTDNVKAKHDPANWRGDHAEVSIARMLSWGFNTAGAWSMDDMTASRRIPYSLIVHVGYQHIAENKKIADPYSAEFKNDLENNLASLAALHGNSPWLLGVFIDNELDWRGGTELVAQILRSSPRTPARQALVAFLRQRHPTLAALNQAWGSEFDSFENVRPHSGPDVPGAYLKDLEDFLALYVDTYFAACARAMDKHFPRHLYLGCRFHVWNPVVTAAASRHCDVVSVNAYRYGVAGFSIHTVVDKPILIGEFHFGTRDYGVWGVGLTWAADSRNQADLVHAYLSDALRHPQIVGAHWFQWSGQAVTGRYDGENFGVGLVSIVDRPVVSLVEAFTAVSDELYDYRRSPRPTRIGSPPPPRPAGEK